MSNTAAVSTLLAGTTMDLLGPSACRLPPHPRGQDRRGRRSGGWGREGVGWSEGGGGVVVSHQSPAGFVVSCLIHGGLGSIPTAPPAGGRVHVSNH